MPAIMRIRLLKDPSVHFGRLRIDQNYSKNGRDPKKALKRLGPSPRNSRDHPMGCTPKSLDTTAFTSPDFIPASTYRILEKGEPLGPNAGKCKTYKNPEYYSYYRFSYYDLRAIVDTIKKKQSGKPSK